MATPAPAREPKPSKEEKLKELAAKRVPAAIDKIRRIGNLGSISKALRVMTDEELGRMANDYTGFPGAVFSLQIIHDEDTHTSRSSAFVAHEAKQNQRAGDWEKVSR